MILDINAFIGKWPYWPVAATKLCEVVDALRGWGIDRACVCSTRSLFVNWEDGNAEAEQATQMHPDQMVAFACLGPLELSHQLPEAGYDFDGYARRGFRGLRLYPQHHSYNPLYAQFVDEVCGEAAARGWPMMLPLRVIMNWGMPMLDVGVVAALIERHPRVPWILAGINYLHELQMALSAMRRFETVHLETSCIMGFDAVAKVVRQVGAERVLFGSGAPLQHGGAGVAKILHANISDAERELVFSGNARRLLNL